MNERNKSPETFRVSERNAERVLRQIRATDKEVPPILVGIDGAGGSGKSTLARQLGGLREDISVVQMDDFYRPMDEATRITLSPQEGYMRYFDWERLRDEVLTLLSMGKPGHYQRYDWPTERVLPEIVPVEPNGVVIVEGVYSLRPELARYYDITVFVETAQAERSRRMAARGENPPEWIHRWMAAEDWYIRDVEPGAKADIVVSGMGEEDLP